jgi:putative PIN family toxin of toxin-antitoxin system
VKVVFDTNILVAAFVFPGGQGDAALQRIVEERDRLVLSKAVLNELLGVLARKFGHDREELARIAVFLSDLASWIEPEITIDVLNDEPDNRILECGVSGGAEAIVTGDKAMLTLAQFRKVRMISLRDYLGKL